MQQLHTWVYWEGEMPQWIRYCTETITLHCPNVQLISREAFEAMCDVDYDIDLNRLCVAHRADFIRAFCSIDMAVCGSTAIA